MIEKVPNLKVEDQTIDQGQEFSYTLNEAEDISNISSGESYTITIIDDDEAGVIYDPDLKSFSGNSSNLAPQRYIIIGSIVDDDNKESLWTFNLIVQPTDITAPIFNIATQTISNGQTFVFAINDSQDITDLRSGESYTMSINSDGGTGILYASSSKTFVGNTASLSSGTYTIAGEITDGDDNSSDWSFDLIVQPATIDQTAPTLTIASQNIDKGALFTYIINENTDISNREPNESYTISITENSGTGIFYSPGPKILIGSTSGLAPGVYAIIGNIEDSNSNSSTWAFTLTIDPGDQTAPTLTIASQSIAKGATFSYSLNESNEISNRELGENYTITITHPNGTGITYNSTTKTFNGATSSLESGVYTIVGTISDDNNNESTWAFNLTIEGGGTTAPPLLNIAAQSVAQRSPFSYTIAESTDISHLESSDTYTIQILDTGGSGVTYDANSYTFSADTTMLDVGRYTILGTIANSSAIQSSWFFYLTLLDQTAPRLNVPIVRVAVGQDFSFPLQRADHILDLREGESYTLSITNDGGTGITYDPTEGALAATTNTLSVGTYTVAGTISDGDSNESTWSLDLLVENPSFLLSRITVGKYQTCSNHSNGGVKCWGRGKKEGLERVQLKTPFFLLMLSQMIQAVPLA